MKKINISRTQLYEDIRERTASYLAMQIGIFTKECKVARVNIDDHVE